MRSRLLLPLLRTSSDPILPCVIRLSTELRHKLGACEIMVLKSITLLFARMQRQIHLYVALAEWHPDL